MRFDACKPFAVTAAMVIASVRNPASRRQYAVRLAVACLSLSPRTLRVALERLPVGDKDNLRKTRLRAGQLD